LGEWLIIVSVSVSLIHEEQWMKASEFDMKLMPI